jgi:hypothetical protein
VQGIAGRVGRLEETSVEARIWTALPSAWRATSSLQSRAAAAPDPVGQHISRVSGSAIARAASTCSTVTSSRYWARGFSAPWWWFFTPTFAICSTVVP